MFEPLDFRSSIPLYVQLVGRIDRLLSSGDLTEGDRLPTTRALADELGINFNTVARAYRIMARAGKITTLRGRGATVQMTGTQAKIEGVAEDPLRILASNFVTTTRQLGFDPEEIAEAVNNVIEAEDE